MRRLLQDTEAGQRLRGQRIRQARIDAGYATQMQLSQALGGASLSSIGAWESGEANPEKYLARLAKVLKLSSTDWLMYDDTEPEAADAPPADELAGITPEQAARMLRLPPERLLEALRARAGELVGDVPKPAPAQRVAPQYSSTRELEPPQRRAKPKPRRK